MASLWVLVKRSANEASSNVILFSELEMVRPVSGEPLKRKVEELGMDSNLCSLFSQAPLPDTLI